MLEATIRNNIIEFIINKPWKFGIWFSGIGLLFKGRSSEGDTYRSCKTSYMDCFFDLIVDLVLFCKFGKWCMTWLVRLELIGWNGSWWWSLITDQPPQLTVNHECDTNLCVDRANAQSGPIGTLVWGLVLKWLVCLAIPTWV